MRRLRFQHTFRNSLMLRYASSEWDWVWMHVHVQKFGLCGYAHRITWNMQGCFVRTATSMIYCFSGMFVHFFIWKCCAVQTNTVFDFHVSIFFLVLFFSSTWCWPPQMFRFDYHDALEQKGVYWLRSACVRALIFIYTNSGVFFFAFFRFYPALCLIVSLRN